MSSWRKKRSVMRRYNLTAQMYDERYCEEQEAKYKVALKDIRLDRKSIVLDVGCGSGLLFRHLAGKVGMSVGVDFSRSLLLLAKERVKHEADFHIVLADADSLPFKQEIFSHIFAFTMLQNMPKPDHTLTKLKEVAKREACFVVTGLKAAVSLEMLGGFLEAVGLTAAVVADDKALKCYVVRAVKP